MSPARGAAQYVVIYDGQCSVCRRLVSLLAEWDLQKILEITQSQAPEIPHRFPWISPGAFEESLQVVRMDDNTTWQGASAIEALLAILPRGRLVSWMFHIPLMRHAIERLYRTFARNRHRLGCQDHCRNR